MTLHPIIQTIKRAAPKWARWFAVTEMGGGFWQAAIGSGEYWSDCGRTMRVCDADTFENFKPFAIHLRTGAVHLQSDDGTITVVSQDEWSAEL